MNGVGYRANLKGKILNLQLGFSHDSTYEIPEGINITVEEQATGEISAGAGTGTSGSTVSFAIELSFSIFCSTVKLSVKIDEASSTTDLTNSFGSSEKDFPANKENTIKTKENLNKNFLILIPIL